LIAAAVDEGVVAVARGQQPDGRRVGPDQQFIVGSGLYQDGVEGGCRDQGIENGLRVPGTSMVSACDTYEIGGPKAARTRIKTVDLCSLVFRGSRIFIGVP